MLNEKAKERLRTLTVEVLLALRSLHLRTGNANALKHWEQIQERARAAARTCASPEEWCTKLQRDLMIPVLNSSASDSVVALVHEVTERGSRSAWLDLVDDEIGYLMALCRLESERRREAAQAAAEETQPQAAKQRGVAFLLDHGEE